VKGVATAAQSSSGTPSKMEQQRLAPLHFFRRTIRCVVSVRRDGRGVVLRIVKRDEKGNEIRLATLLNKEEVGSILLFPSKSVVDEKGSLSFFHRFSRGESDSSGKGGEGRIIAFEKDNDGKGVRVALVDRERNQSLAFTFTPGEWTVLQLYLKEALRECFYAGFQRNRDSEEAGSSAPQAEADADDVIDEEEDIVYDLL